MTPTDRRLRFWDWRPDECVGGCTKYLVTKQYPLVCVLVSVDLFICVWLSVDVFDSKSTGQNRRTVCAHVHMDANEGQIYQWDESVKQCGLM